MIRLGADAAQSKQLLLARGQDETVPTRDAAQILIGKFAVGHAGAESSKRGAVSVAADLSPLCRYRHLEIDLGRGQGGVHDRLALGVDRHKR